MLLERLPNHVAAGVEWPKATLLATGLERPFAPSFSWARAVVTGWGRMAAQVEWSSPSISAIRPQPPRCSIAVLACGGQTLSLLLTLIAVPVIYSVLDDLGNLLSFHSLAGPTAGDPAGIAHTEPT